MINQLIVVYSNLLEQPPSDSDMPHKMYMHCKRIYAKQITTVRKYCMASIFIGFGGFPLLGWLIVGSGIGAAIGISVGAVGVLGLQAFGWVSEQRQLDARETIWSAVLHEQLPNLPAAWLARDNSSMGELRHTWAVENGIDEETFLALARDNEHSVEVVTSAARLLDCQYVR